MTPDFSPIMGKTPIDGFYVDAGWGTWGFKATPVCGKTMAYTLANDDPHPLIVPFSLSRFEKYELVGEKGAASVGHQSIFTFSYLEVPNETHALSN